jgi:hypothetical protein
MCKGGIMELTKPQHGTRQPHVRVQGFFNKALSYTKIIRARFRINTVIFFLWIFLVLFHS